MAIQLLGLRDYVNHAGKASKKHAFFESKLFPDSVESLFNNLDYWLEKVPPEERYNLYFTPAHCFGQEPRDFSHSDIIPLDIDDVDLSRLEETVDVIVETLALDKSRTGILCSGNGIQLFIKNGGEFKEDFFVKKKPLYKLLVQKLNHTLQARGLKGEADPVVFEPRRLMRLPGTINKKPGRPERPAFLIQGNIASQPFYFEKVLGVPVVKEEDQLSLKALSSFPPADTSAVLSECGFLKNCKNHQDKISEPEWFAMLSIVGHLEDGPGIAHEYSKKHPGYSVRETDQKLEQAITTAGPRTCKNISTLWDGCGPCKHWGKIKSPILIHGPEFIRTKSTGFHDVLVTQTGAVKKKPNYNDLHKYFNKKHPYFTQSDTSNVYVFNGKFWEEWPHLAVEAFAEDNFDPKPRQADRAEFLAKVLTNNLKAKEWVETSTDKKICLENGVYDISTGELLPHSQKFFFTGCLPYKFDPYAKAPRFEKFMEEISCGDSDIQRNLLEFAGYAISGDPCWLHKAVVLYGEGANGKSTYLEVLKALVGEGLYSSLSLTALEDAAKRHLLVGKLFNVGEETNVYALAQSEVFKTAVSGGELDVKRLYQQPFQYRNKAKMIFACNKLPHTSDDSEGFFRRLVLIPFKAHFDGRSANKNLKNELMEELPGILNLVVDAYRNLWKRQDLETGAALDEALQEYREDNEMFFQWANDHITITGKADDFVTFLEIHERFKDFAEKLGIHKSAYSYKEVGHKLGSFVKRHPECHTSKRYPNKKQARGIVGVKLESDF